ncbi:MAG: monofunctional biosynthetic peptidoglycan transglycosylase [Candidatus Latescibacterota bacterium]
MFSFFKKIIIAAILFPILFTGFYMIFPRVSVLKENNPEKTSFMKYREREWRTQGLEKKIVQTWVPLSRISPQIVKAVIISEDDKFWTHEGFDFEEIHKAIDKDLKRKKFKYGASTISQQLAKNLYLTPDRNPIRKLKEFILTSRLEHTLTKKRILELYLNVAEWGDGIFGIEAAAHYYFGRSAASLGPLEAARLAAVLPNPRKYSARNPSKYIENRAQRIYSIMAHRDSSIYDLNEIRENDTEPDKLPAVNP